MSRRLPGILALAWLVSAAAPAAAQSRREMQMMADIRMLQEQTQQLQQQLAAAIEQLSVNLKAIVSRQDEQTAQTRKSFADQKLVIDQFATDLRFVRERIDESNVRITTLSQEVEALRLAIPTFTAPATAPAAPVDPGAPAGAPAPPVDPAAPVATTPPMAPGSPTRMFNTALGDFTAGQWALCIQGFDMYLRSFARTDAADDAQWYIGECHYNDGKFPAAVDAYNRVIVNFPKGDRVPDAYYKRGVAFTNMKQPDQARESFEMLIKLFPDHDAARLAKQQLTRLTQGKPPGNNQ
jgi:tol-pal system protein YbgF